MESLFRNIRVLWRADAIIAEIQLRQVLLRSGITAVAALIAVFGLLMIEVAAFLILRDRWGDIQAAAVLGFGNIAFAMVLFGISTRVRSGRELALAAEVHKSAIEALQSDARRLQGDFSAMTSVLKHPLESTLPALVVPLIGVLIKTLKKTHDPKQT